MTEHSHLSETQRALLAHARELGREVLQPLAEKGEPGRINRPLVRALGEQGPPERGGGLGRRPLPLT
jgi:acyl-CoA dehydrogenase